MRRLRPLGFHHRKHTAKLLARLEPLRNPVIPAGIPRQICSSRKTQSGGVGARGVWFQSAAAANLGIARLAGLAGMEPSG